MSRIGTISPLPRSAAPGNGQLIAERSAQLLEDQFLFLDHRIDRHTQAAVAGLDDQHGLLRQSRRRWRADPATP